MTYKGYSDTLAFGMIKNAGSIKKNSLNMSLKVKLGILSLTNQITK